MIFLSQIAPLPSLSLRMERRILALRNEHLLLASRAEYLDREGYYDLAEKLRKRAQRVRRILARLSSRWYTPTLETALSASVLWPH